VTEAITDAYNLDTFIPSSPRIVVLLMSHMAVIFDFSARQMSFDVCVR
jgi:hypothetical protein